MVYQVASCGSRPDFLLVATCQPCMYALSPPPPLLHFLFPLLYPLPYLTPHSSHPHTNFLTLTVTLTHHTPHTDTENVFHLMVWVLDDRQKKRLHPLPLTPFPTSKPAGKCPLQLLRQQQLDHYSMYLQKSPYRRLPLVMNGLTWTPTNSCYGC